MGLLTAMCGTSNELESNLESDKSYSNPSAMGSQENDVKIFNLVKNFNIENIQMMNEGTVSVDLNKFMLKDNIYDTNFVSNAYGLINFIKIYRVFINNDILQYNTGIYKEAQNYYGSIPVDISDNTFLSGGIKLAVYFSNYGLISSLDTSEKIAYYPSTMIQIVSALVIEIDTITFDGNYLFTLQPSTTDNVDSSECFAFKFCKGSLTIKNLYIQNLEGINITAVSEVLGDDSVSMLTASPTERSDDGSVLATVNFPDFYIHFGCQNPMINFYDSGSVNAVISKNYFDRIIIDGLYMENIKWYNPTSYFAMFATFQDDLGYISISNIEMDNIDCYSNLYTMFHVKHNGDFEFLNGMLKNLNLDAYQLSPTFYYTTNYGILRVDSIDQYDGNNDCVRLIQNITLDTSYAYFSNFLYVHDSSTSATYQDTNLTLDSITIKN